MWPFVADSTLLVNGPAIGIIVEYLSFIIRFSRNIIINSSYYYNYITLLYSVILFEFQSVIKCYIKYRFKEIFFQ